eukprot:gene14685-14808_t
MTIKTMASSIMVNPGKFLENNFLSILGFLSTLDDFFYKAYTENTILDIKNSWHRGTRELDLILGEFSDKHLSTFSEKEVDEYALILKENDLDLWQWISGKTSAANYLPFPEGIDDVGPDPVQNHRHFVKVAWRLLDQKLGYIDARTDFVRDDNAFINFRELVRAQMRFQNTGLQTHDNGYVDFGGFYIDNGVGKTNQYGGLNLGKIALQHTIQQSVTYNKLAVMH